MENGILMGKHLVPFERPHDGGSGEKIVRMITKMADRENGVGAGFAMYGLIPDREDYFCFQMLPDDEEAGRKVRESLNQYALEGSRFVASVDQKAEDRN